MQRLSKEAQPQTSLDCFFFLFLTQFFFWINRTDSWFVFCRGSTKCVNDAKMLSRLPHLQRGKVNVSDFAKRYFDKMHQKDACFSLLNVLRKVGASHVQRKTPFPWMLFPRKLSHKKTQEDMRPESSSREGEEWFGGQFQAPGWIPLGPGEN